MSTSGTCWKRSSKGGEAGGVMVEVLLNTLQIVTIRTADLKNSAIKK
jgi:hypothetical protein